MNFDKWKGWTITRVEIWNNFWSQHVVHSDPTVIWWGLIRITWLSWTTWLFIPMMSHWFIVRSVSGDIPDMSGLGRCQWKATLLNFYRSMNRQLAFHLYFDLFSPPPLIVISIGPNLKLDLKNLLKHWKDPTMTKYVRQDFFDNFLKTEKRGIF